MDRDTRDLLDEYRLNDAGPIENSLIDDLFAGEIDRGSFIRRATVVGLSAGTIGAVLRAMGHTPAAYGATVLGKAGGRLRVGVIPGPTGDLEPSQFADHGRLVTGSVCGEFLCRTKQDLTLAPELAVNWTTNADGTLWAFNLRKTAKFPNGQPLTADDVVATFNRLIDPNGGSGALSAFKGVLSPGGVRKEGTNRVVFQLDAATATFPYLTSSSTYQAIILPASYKLGTFTKTPQTTGPFNLVSYTPGVGARFDRNPNWWGGKALLDGVDLTYYADDAAVVAALLGGQIDLISQVNFSSDRALFGNKNVQIFATGGSPHRQISMLTRTAAAAKPLMDWRVRQAIALTLDRPKIVKQLLGGYGDPGNDSPFAPVYPSTGHSVLQRHQNLALAKKLMAQAGYAHGFKVTLTTEKFAEIPQLAQILASSVKKIGIDMSLDIITSDAYYGGTYAGGATGRGTTPWLNTPINITDWAARATPNVVLNSAFATGGVWSGSDYTNAKLDKLIKQYTAALRLKDQRKYAKQIETILLHDTPVIFPYFFKWTQAGSKKIKGFKVDAIGLLALGKTSLG